MIILGSLILLYIPIIPLLQGGGGPRDVYFCAFTMQAKKPGPDPSSDLLLVGNMGVYNVGIV